MAERRVADVVDERERFSKVGVQSQRRGDGAGDLGNFERVRQTIAEMIRVACSENLRLGFQATKSAGMDDAIAVARIGTAVRMGRFGIAPAAGLFRAHCPGSRSGNWFDGPLRNIPAEPRNFVCAERIKISAKEYPGRDRPDPQWRYPGIPF